MANGKIIVMTHKRYADLINDTSRSGKYKTGKDKDEDGD